MPSLWSGDEKMFFGREVDLVDASSVKNPYFIEELAETRRVVYGGFVAETAL